VAIYRANPGDGVAWITGASSGIGRRLALELAREGYTVAATARSAGRLDALAHAAGGPGKIIPFPGNVTDAAGMAAVVSRIENEAGPLVLAVFSAGAYFPARPPLETENFAKSYEINVLGMINCLVPAVGQMERHGRGHIAIIGSASGYGGLPSAAAYGATKAALNHTAMSLKFDLDKMNIRIQVINPGFVDTPLTKNSKIPMPALMQPEEAARRIARALKSGGFEVAFPRRLTWPLKLINLLPHAAYFALMNRVTGWHKRAPRGTRRR
jgi:NAD(P)-dependent dehydrogenase (short-subunit alcohol dehydrogenase family)